VSQIPKNPVVIPPALTRRWACAFTRGFRFTPPLRNYSRSTSTWNLQFSSASQLRASKKKCVQKIGYILEKESSFKEFLASPAQCNLDFTCFLSESIKPSFLGCMRVFPAYFLSTLNLFIRVAFSELVSCKDLFSSQAEKDFDNENNTLTHTLTHSHRNLLRLLGTFVPSHLRFSLILLVNNKISSFLVMIHIHHFKTFLLVAHLLYLDRKGLRYDGFMNIMTVMDVMDVIDMINLIKVMAC
jgi:hypothetical protein